MDWWTPERDYTYSRHVSRLEELRDDILREETTIESEALRYKTLEQVTEEERKRWRVKAVGRHTKLHGTNMKENREDALQLYVKLKGIKRISLEKLLAMAERKGAQLFGGFMSVEQREGDPFYDTTMIFGIEDQKTLKYAIVSTRHAEPGTAYQDRVERLKAQGIICAQYTCKRSKQYDR